MFADKDQLQVKQIHTRIVTKCVAVLCSAILIIETVRFFAFSAEEYPARLLVQTKNVNDAAENFRISCGNTLHGKTNVALMQFCNDQFAQSHRSPHLIAWRSIFADWLNDRSWLLRPAWCEAGSTCYHTFYNLADKVGDSIWIIIPFLCITIFMTASCIKSIYHDKHQAEVLKLHAHQMQINQRLYAPQNYPVFSAQITEDAWDSENVQGTRRRIVPAIEEVA
jgi:hypothetical protein